MTDDHYDPYATGRILGKRPDSQPPPGEGETEPEPGVNGIAAGQLRSIVERIERLEEEKAAIADDIKDVYGEAKGNGFDTKVLRQIIRLRKQDAGERQEQEAIKDLYLHALGMAADPDVLIPDDPEARASRALAKADEKIRRRRARKED